MENTTIKPRHRFWVVSSLLGMALFASTAEAGIRWASSSNRIYLEDGVTATLSDIKAARPNAPLDLVDPTQKIWLLRANLQITDGSTLILRGTGAGGDVDQLRLQSNNTSTTNNYVSITADYGNIDIDSTAITSWDVAAAGPDTEYGSTYKRAFIRVRSSLAADGVTALESRMDINNSDIGYLGYYAAESYGLAWKVIGSAPGLYDLVQVRGDIIDSRIHHNYFGIYTYGHQDGLWSGNDVDYNVKYGFDPHDDSDDIVIENNNVHHNGNHGIIASQRCDHLVIRNNDSWANTGNGIMLHRTSDDALVEGNRSYDNTDSGIAIFASSRTVIRDNAFTNNGNAGMRFSVGASDNTIENNQIESSGKYGVYFYKGSDAPNAGDDGRPKRNMFLVNTVVGSVQEGVKMTDGDANEFLGNTFLNNGQTTGKKMRFTTSTATVFSDNANPSDAVFVLTGSSSVPTSITFSKQPRINLSINQTSFPTFTATDQAIFDPDETVYTQATGLGSTLALDYTQTGTSTTVHTRALFANPLDGSSVLVNPTVWTENDRQWKSQSSSTTTSVAYTVGELVAGTSYSVREAGVLLGNFVADASGRIAFTATPGTTSIVNYTVQM
ncbi:MAG: NosD domain-containing protein [Porticoccaceae bacterium]